MPTKPELKSKGEGPAWSPTWQTKPTKDVVRGPVPAGPHLMAVEARDDHTLLLTFENGERRLYDARPLLDTEVFAPLKDLDVFRQVRVEWFGLEWPGERDLAYDTLYAASEPAGDGLEEPPSA